MEGAAIVTFEDRSLKIALPKRKPLSAARLWEKCCTHFGLDGDRFELQSDGAPISGDVESRAMLAIVAKPKTRAVAAPPPAPEPAAAPPSSERRVPFEPAGAGVAIGHDAYFGHILVAERDFAPGDLVLDEAPLMTWRRSRDLSTGDFYEYLDAFAAAPDASKELILEMWAPPLDGTDASTQTARQLAAELVRTRPEFDLGLAHRLVLIHTTNAHETRDATGGERGALFHVASKVSHSCAPNATFATRGARLNYRCIRPIKAGEQVTFSYVGHDAWRQRREERRATLKQRYFFTCRCDHCAGPDPCRALRGRGGGVARPRADGVWVGGDVAERLPAEAAIRADVEAAAAKLATLSENPGGAWWTSPDGEPEPYAELARRAAYALSPAHALVADALHSLAQIHFWTCEALEDYAPSDSGPPPPKGTAHEARYACCRAMLEASAVCESIAADCPDGAACGRVLEPLPEALNLAWTAAEELTKLPREFENVSALLAFASKYVPLFEIAHGADDAAVRAFAARAAGLRVPPARDVFAPEPRARRCDVCGAAGKLLACSLCKDRQYCSRAHQRLAWPAHKKACRKQPSPA